MNTGENRKGNLEDLSKEDLIKKCKNLISLAQKTKTLKESLQEENLGLRRQLEHSSQGDASSELLEKLTEEKLSLVTQIEDLKLKCRKSESEQDKIIKLETENVSYSRQVKRLTDENEQLISDLSTLEGQISELHKLGVQQKAQLLELEKSNGALQDLQSKLSASLEHNQKLNSTLINKDKEIAELHQEIQALKIVSKSNKTCDNHLQEIRELNTKSDILTKELVDIQGTNEKLKQKIALYHSKLKKFALATKDIKEEKNEIIKNFKAYTDQIKEWKDQLFSASIQLSNLLNELKNREVELHKEKQALEEKLDSVNKELIDLNETNQKYGRENGYLNKSLAKSKEEINELNEALKQSVHTEKKFAEKSSEEILRLAQSNKELEEKCAQIENQLVLLQNKALEHKIIQTEQNIPEENGIDLKRENSEMLLEMNQMNQALKERGEIISKLEAHCEEIKKKLQLYETQANKNVDSITEKDETIKGLTQELESLRKDNRDTEIANLKAELNALKDKGNNVDTYAESETMSTSTISRSEEVNRLKDLEGSWEERYGKLRTFAIKLKARIKEQDNTLSKLETEKTELHKKLKTIPSLQAQSDKLQDELDKVQADNKQYLTKLNSVAESISKDKTALLENEETIFQLQKEVQKLSEEKKGVENWKKQVSAKVQTLRKELEANKLLLKESESRISKLEGELEAKASQLKAEQESHKQTKALLEQTSSECKKTSVLNLEMQDYERSAKELSQKIEKQKLEIANLQSQLDMQKNTVSALREQNKTLEDRIEEALKTGNSSTLEVNACKKNIANLEQLLQQKEDKFLDVAKLLEAARSENEELSTELSKVIAEHQKSFGILKSERDQLRNQLLSVQQNLRDNEYVLKMREDELNLIKGDYETYKVRAQSVLKKNQNRDLGLEEKLTEELATVRSRNNKLEDELGDVREKLENQQASNELVTKQRDESLKKCKELESDLEDFKNYIEQLEVKHQKIIGEHAETIRNLKVHAETLAQCYRQQLSEQETRHNREIVELQSRLDKAPSPVETGPVHPNMPREEGEGSESIESNPPPNNVHPIPLERLLDSKSDDELRHLKKLLLEQESKVVHLTALLSDTEQDLAKHVQMNKVLKEEIRRQQRSVEREEHAENLEYLKNVVFKFITLNNGDERTRLVPVLNTILKLSPEETQKLSMVAKGDPGLKGWTNYLPIWSSPNKPQ